MSLKFGVAPCSWGIEDPSNPDNPAWTKVLDEAGMSGFKGIELGPYGYFPEDAVLLQEALEAEKLELVAGTIYDDLTGTADSDYLENKTGKICRLLSEIAGPGNKGFLVIIDDVKPKRNATAGHPGAAMRLPAKEWEAMMRNVKRIARIASEDFGVRPVVHPHAGGYIEFEDETEMFLNDIDGKTAGLCLDTGHLYYSGSNPAVSLEKYSSRLDYVHFKDINETVYKQVLKERMGFFDACRIGVMCSIGGGCIDYPSVITALDKIDYSGWVTIEQERDPRNSSGTLEDLKKSFRYLEDKLNPELK